MDYLNHLIESINIPILTAFLLGLMTAISPCPLATNITATAYISKNITSKKKVFLSGLLYALGKAFSYSVLGLVFYFGANQYYVKKFFMLNGEKVLGPLLIFIGLVMLNVIKLNFLGKSTFQERLSEKFKDKGLLGSFLIGLVFALAFCPTSGALFFAGLIPMTMTSASGLFLPVVFGFGTALPVLLFTYLLAFAASNVGVFYGKIQKIERIMRIVTATIFILVGVYYLSLFFNIF